MDPNSASSSVATVTESRLAPVHMPVQRARALVSWLALTTVGLLILRLSAPAESVLAVALEMSALTLAPFIAVVGALTAARATAGPRAMWYVYAVGATVSLVGQAWWSVYHLPSAGSAAPALATFPFLAFHVFFAAAVALAVRPPRVNTPPLEVALDLALLSAVAMVIVLRFGIGPVAIAQRFDTSEILERAVVPLTAIASLFFAGLLLAWRDSTITARVVLPLIGAAATFAAGTLLMSLAPAVASANGSAALELIWVSGWALLGFAGSAAAQSVAAPQVERVFGAVTTRVHRVVVPGTIVMLTVLAIDLALHPVATRATAIAFAVLGLLLVARADLALRASARQAREKLQLVQTRAIVEVSRALAGATEVDRTLDLVAQWARRLLDARAAAIELVVEPGEFLELRAASGFGESAIGMRFEVARSFTGWVVRNRRERVTDDPATDPLMQPQSLAHLGHSPVASVPLQYGEHSLGALSCVRDRPFDPNDIELLRALADQAAIAIETAQLFEQVRNLSLTDPLTGLANRRQLERDMARELAAARRGRKVAIVLFDLDDFKPYTDRFGHLAGDQALRVFGSILRVETRAMNLAARYGGDEFVVLLSDSDEIGAAIFAERVRQRFRDEVQSLGYGPIGLSYGIAEYRQELADANDFFAAADRALYDSKAVKASR